MTRRLYTVALVALVTASSHALVAGQTMAPRLPSTLTNDPQIAELWEPPTALAERDLYNGPWGMENAPDPNAVYSFIAPIKGGTNPGMIVRDPRGREWEVQSRRTPPRDTEGAIEVVLSRVLSAVGFRQPPIYFLPAFHLVRDATMRIEPGGVFRLTVDSLTEIGEWSWQANPYANSRPLGGLLAILQLFERADLHEANNTLYQVVTPDGRVTRWFVVSEVAPGSNTSIINRITPADVRWASYLLSRLTPEQWHDAFRAGGYRPAASEPVIRQLHAKIGDGLALGETTVR